MVEELLDTLATITDNETYVDYVRECIKAGTFNVSQLVDLVKLYQSV